MLLLIAGTWEDQSGVYIEALGRVVSFLEPLPSIFIGDYKPYTRIATNAVHAQQDRRMLSFYPSFVIINTRCNTRHEMYIKEFIILFKSLDHDFPCLLNAIIVDIWRSRKFGKRNRKLFFSTAIATIWFIYYSNTVYFILFFLVLFRRSNERDKVDHQHE